MTYDECEIVADAALRLRELRDRMFPYGDEAIARELDRGITSVLGLLASIPLTGEDEPSLRGDGQNERRICSECGRLGWHFYRCTQSHGYTPPTDAVV